MFDVLTSFQWSAESHCLAAPGIALCLILARSGEYVSIDTLILTSSVVHVHVYVSYGDKSYLFYLEYLYYMVYILKILLWFINRHLFYCERGWLHLCVIHLWIKIGVNVFFFFNVINCMLLWNNHFRGKTFNQYRIRR